MDAFTTKKIDLFLEKGLPRFAEFTIVENSKNITLKKQFPRVCTVGQVVAWCVKQMENSSEKSHYGLFHKDLLLDSERFLFTFEQLNNKVISGKIDNSGIFRDFRDFSGFSGFFV